jgi:hypothetical protein
MEKEVIIAIGGILFILFVIILLKKKKRKRQIFFPIKKVTACKDSVCHDFYTIQGVPDKEFKTFEEAKQYALLLEDKSK